MNNINFISSLDDTSCVVKEESVYDSLFKQYERVVLESLITSFGLDMLMGDKHGGDVDTIHNVRQVGNDPRMAYKNKQNEQDYENRGEYICKDYHTDSRFTEKKSDARKKYNDTGIGEKDAYTGGDLEHTTAETVPANKRAELDHVVECMHIHNDRGRVLAGTSGIELANDIDNLAWTNKSLNASMGSWARHKNDEYREKYGCDAPLDVVGIEAYLKEHPNIDPETQARMRAQYAKSRKVYEKRIAREYYTSKKFFGDTAIAAGKLSFKMGIKAALGLVFAELWFAARDEIAKIASYGAELFNAIGRGIRKGFENAKAKYKEIWHKFLDGAIAGVISSLVTTLTNIFFTTAKNVVRIIRQSWSTLVEATKILLINPDCLRFGERIRAASKVLGTGACVLAGIMVTEAVSKTPLGTIPFAGEIAAAFCGTFVCGIMSCSLLYLLDRNETINKIVRQLDKLPTIENYIAYAKEQARLLEEHAAKVYNLDVVRFRTESSMIAKALENISSEMNDLELTIALKDTYVSLNLLLPWGENTSFNDFMQDRNQILTFK